MKSKKENAKDAAEARKAEAKKMLEVLKPSKHKDKNEKK